MIIKIKKYPLFVRLGVFEEERIKGQDVLITLHIQLSPSSLKQISHDDLKGTVDYGEFLNHLTKQFHNIEIQLIEALVLEIGQDLLATYPRIESLRIEVEKPVIPGQINKGAEISVEHQMTRQ